MDTTNTNINAIDAAPGVENSMHENDDVIAQQQTPNACSKSSSRSSPDNADVHSITKEHNRQLRLVCPNHKEININRLEKWKLQNHHRAIVNLLLCLAGSEVWSSAPNTKAGREDRILIAYKRWVAVWKKAQPFCRVNAFLMYNSTTKPKEFSKHILERRFRECVRQPLAKCSATCIRFLQHPDFNNGKTPIDDRQWLEVLENTEKWWYMQECIRKEMDSRRRKRNKYNNSAAVKSGQIARSKSPIAIEEGWKPRSMQSEDPLIPLISRFCPVLCAGLGFAKSPISSFSGLRPENLTSLLQTPKSITSQPENRNMQSQEKASNVDNQVDVHNKQHSVETNEEQVRLMRSMSEEHNRNVRPAKRKANADRNKDWASLIKQERKERESKQKNLLRRVELLRNKLIRCPEEKQKYKKEIIQLIGNELDILTLPDPVAGNPATFKFVNLHEAGDLHLGFTDGLSPSRKKTTVAVTETPTQSNTPKPDWLEHIPPWSTTLSETTRKRLFDIVNKIAPHKFKKDNAGDVGFPDATYECTEKQKKVIVCPVFLIIHEHYTCMQNIKTLVHRVFKRVCPNFLRQRLRWNDKATRYSINKIEQGLTWHLDGVIPHQEDDGLTVTNCLPSQVHPALPQTTSHTFTSQVPGLTFAIHIGPNKSEVVHLEFKENMFSPLKLVSGSVYCMPGNNIT